MLLRLAPLALVMLAACEHAPDYSACPIVGRWRWEGTNPAVPKPDGGLSVSEMVFRADGTAQPTLFEINCSWRLVEHKGNHIVVEFPEMYASAGAQVRTFDFEGNDILHESGYEGPRTWTRVSNK